MPKESLASVEIPVIGETVSHYRIVERLGGGGMGVVYKADDTRLKRTVALKFLPPELTLDPAAKQRFVHEAQAASALHHPNICVVHDIDETAEGRMFIVMEHYEGETLKSRIEKGPLGVDQVLDIALQVAQGLARAHEKGIVHRDVKPANILIGPDGTPTIVDFGLAKLSQASRLTRTGSTLGTVPYMSPEQLQGLATDHRTDIWSFGVTLFEMLTRTLPFRGEHDAAVMYSIVNSDPASLEDELPEAPIPLAHILGRLLEKAPEDRYQSMEEVAIELRRVRRVSSRVTTGPVPLEIAHLSRKPAPRRARRRPILIGAIASLLVVAGLSTLAILTFGRGVVLNPNRTTRSLELPFKEVMNPSISADGNWIAYRARGANGKWNIYMTHSSTGEVVLVADSVGGGEWSTTTDLSPDGSKILFDRGYGRGLTVVTVGGLQTPLRLDGFNAQWTPLGERIGYVRRDARRRWQFWTASPTGSQPTLEFTDSTSSDAIKNFFFAWSPDGASVAWIRTFREGYEEIFLHPLDSHEEVQLTSHRARIRDLWWTRQGVILFSSTKSGALNLWMVPAEGGAPVQLTSGGGPDSRPRSSSDGRVIIYCSISIGGQVWIAPSAGGERVLVDANESTIWDPGPMLSPDGNLVALPMSAWHTISTSGASRVYVIDRNGRNRRTLGIETGNNFRLLGWSPDSRRVAITADSTFFIADTSDIFAVDVHGTTPPVKIARLPEVWGGRWLDSTRFLVSTGGAKVPRRSYLVSLVDGEVRLISRDSLWIVGVPGQQDTLVRDFRAASNGWWIYGRSGNRRFPVSTSTEYGHYLNYFIRRDELSQKLQLVSIPDGRITEPGLVIPAGFNLVNISRDGREVLLDTYVISGKISRIDNPFEGIR